MADHKALLERARRAGEIAQAIFYTFIEHTWSYDIKSVRITRDEHGEIVRVGVVHGPGSETRVRGKSTCERYAGGSLFKFPQEAFEPADLFVKHALLADGQSVWAFVFMHVAVQTLFKDLVNDTGLDIKEVVHYVAPHARRIVQYSNLDGLECNRSDLPYFDEDAKGGIKGVYYIKLKDDTSIALDFAGAQYTLFHKTVVPWSTYINCCADEIKYRIPFRSHHNKHIGNMNRNNTITHLTIITQQMALVNTLLAESDSILGFDLNTLLSQNSEAFQNANNRLSNYFTEHAADLDGNANYPTVAPSNDFNRLEIMADTAVGEPVFLNLGDMSKFDWSKLSEMVKMKGGEVTYKEKKKARSLLQHRCVYRMPKDWRLVFLADEMPSTKVPGKFVCENPYWSKRK